MSTHKTHPGDVELKFASKTLIVGFGKVEHPPKDGKAKSPTKTLGKSFRSMAGPFFRTPKAQG